MVKYAKIADYVINGRVYDYYVKNVSRVPKRGYIPCSERVYDAFKYAEDMYLKNIRYGRKSRRSLVRVDLIEDINLSHRIVEDEFGDIKCLDTFDSFIVKYRDDIGDEDDELNELRISLGFPVW